MSINQADNLIIIADEHVEEHAKDVDSMNNQDVINKPEPVNEGIESAYWNSSTKAIFEAIYDKLSKEFEKRFEAQKEQFRTDVIKEIKDDLNFNLDEIMAEPPASAQFNPDASYPPSELKPNIRYEWVQHLNWYSKHLHATYIYEFDKKLYKLVPIDPEDEDDIRMSANINATFSYEKSMQQLQRKARNGYQQISKQKSPTMTLKRHSKRKFDASRQADAETKPPKEKASQSLNVDEALQSTSARADSRNNDADNNDTHSYDYNDNQSDDDAHDDEDRIDDNGIDDNNIDKNGHNNDNATLKSAQKRSFKKQKTNGIPDDVIVIDELDEIDEIEKIDD